MLVGMPPEWAGGMAAELNRSAQLASLARPQLFLMGGLLYCAIACLRSRSPKVGILGALATLHISIVVLGRWSPGACIHIATVYLLVHSMGWVMTDSSSLKIARYAVAGFWILHSFLWTWDG